MPCFAWLTLLGLGILAKSGGQEWWDYELRDNCEDKGSGCFYQGQPCKCLPEREDGNETKLELIQILTNGSGLIANYPHLNDALIALGVSGTGKTTAIQITAGNLSRLHAVAIPGGDLAIWDENNTIGAGSVSKTLFPQLFTKEFNTSANISFYDFPGFRETRGSVPDIAANYLMNGVVKTIENVKLLFVTTWGAITSRQGVRELTESAAAFVKDVESMKQSIGLIVNKVAAGKTHPDVKSLINYSFGDYLAKDLEPDFEENPNDEFLRNKIAFVKTFLEVETNFWFIETPGECGVLNCSTNFQYIRQNLTDLCERLRYMPVKQLAFGFALNDDTKDEIKNVHIRTVDEGISNNFTAATEKLYEWYVGKNVKKDVPYLQLETFFYTESQRATSLMTNISISPENISNLISNYWESIGYNVSYEFLEFLELQQSFLEFFDTAIGDPQPRNVALWTRGLQLLPKQLMNLRWWFSFCSELEQTLVSFDFHKNIPNPPSNVTTWNQWLEYIRNNNILADIKPEVLEAASSLNQSEIDILKDLFEFVMAKPLPSYEGTKLIVTGNFIKVSEAFQNVPSKCDGDVTEIHVYASHTIILDQDINLQGKGCEVVFLAPFWVGDVDWKLALVGASGPEHDSPKADNGEDGNDDRNPTEGKSGCAGLPGFSGGYFFGVATKVTARRSISVDASGGAGGLGQTGGNGGTGGWKDACWCPDSSNYDHVSRCYYNPTTNFPSCIQDGIQGFQGARGGDGGVGGLGGFAGDVKSVIFLEEDSILIEETESVGLVGIAGNGGDGGRGGKPGKGYICHRFALLFICQSMAPSAEFGPNGSPGTPGGSSSCLRDPVRSPRRLNETLSLIKYITQFSEVKKHVTTEFINHICAQNTPICT